MPSRSFALILSMAFSGSKSIEVNHSSRMENSKLSHRRTHNLLLISKLLNQKDNVSPITILLDSLELPAKPLLTEYLRRAEVRLTDSLP